MTKGFKLTLALVAAFATLGFNAMATAPTISEITDYIIGDAGETGTFVYADVIDADAVPQGNPANIGSIVQDDVTPTTQILWSFTEATATYRINGKDSNAGDKVTPAAASDLTIDDPVGTDGDAFTFSFDLPDPTGSGLDGGDTNPQLGRVVTLFASDGTTVDLNGQSFMLYAQVDGDDAASGTVAQFDPVQNYNFIGNTNGWTFEDSSAGTILSRTNNGLGIEAEVVATGGVSGNFGIAQWNQPSSDYPAIVDQAVWRIQLSASSTPSGSAPPPTFDVVITNRDSANQYFAYFADYYFVPRPDQGSSTMAPAGSANPNGVSDYYIYYAPNALLSSAWQSFLNTPANTPKLSWGMFWRVIDLPAASLPFGDLVGGQIDITLIKIDRTDVSNMNDVGSVFGGTTLDAASFAVNAPAGYTSSFAGGNLSLSGTLGTGGFQQVFVIPGTNSDPNNTDNASYPIVWTQNKLLNLRVELTGDGSAPADALRLMMQSADFELLAESNVARPDSISGSAAPTMPPTSATVYHAWFFTHNPSAAASFQRLRPFVNFFTLDTLFGGTTNGGLTVSQFEVVEVNFGDGVPQ